jgi:hypothetical protein
MNSIIIVQKLGEIQTQTHEYAKGGIRGSKHLPVTGQTMNPTF